MADYQINFDTRAYQDLDQFALLACQKYNLGNTTEWFGTFRGGLYGFYARLHGVSTHYYNVHAWLVAARTSAEKKYHVSSILFNIDSSIECLVFAMNALGSAFSPGSFRDVSDGNELRKIAPRDIFGRTGGNKPLMPLHGYGEIFPEVQSLWQSRIDLVEKITELHDVSKHRQTIYLGGLARNDPPPGFYESLGIPDDPFMRSRLWPPNAENVLLDDPKLPRKGRVPTPLNRQVLLETLPDEFKAFIQDTGNFLLKDAKTHVILKEQVFK